MPVTLETIMKIYKTLTKNVTKKDPVVRVSIIFLTQHVVQLGSEIQFFKNNWSFDSLNFSFLEMLILLCLLNIVLNYLSWQKILKNCSFFIVVVNND